MRNNVIEQLVDGHVERVRDDVLNELVSREPVERGYGVVLTADGAVNEAATGRRRSV